VAERFCARDIVWQRAGGSRDFEELLGGKVEKLRLGFREAAD
jgi:hypothetical protein